MIDRAEPGDAITAFWFSNTQPWLSTTAPRESAKQFPSFPDRPAALPSATPAVGKSDKKQKEVADYNAQITAFSIKVEEWVDEANAYCKSSKELDAELAAWRKEQRAQVPKDAPPPASTSPVVEAIGRGAAAFSGSNDVKVLILTGDLEPYGARTSLPVGLLAGVRVVVGPFRPSERPFDEAREAVRAFLAPAKGQLSDFVSDDRPAKDVVDAVWKARDAR